MVLPSPYTAVIRMPARRNRRIAVAWLLTLGFLCQPLLTYLVTPMVGHDAQGQMVVEQCTLMGSKKLASPLALAIGAEPGHDHAMHSALPGDTDNTGHSAHQHHAGSGHQNHASNNLAPDPSGNAAQTPANPAPLNSEHCPALTLYKVAGSAQILLPPAIVTLTPDTLVRFVPVADLFHHTVAFSDYLTRAPPAFS